MRSCRRLGAVAILAAALAGDGRATGLDLPSLDGRFAGSFQLNLVPGAPRLHWQVTLQTPVAAQRRAEIVAEGTGTRLRLELDLNPETGDGRWTLAEGALDARTWIKAAAPWLGGTAEDLIAEGMVELSGEGEWREGRPRGVVQTAWRGGRLEHVGEGWTLEGVNAAGSFAFDGTEGRPRSESPFEVTIATITTRRFGARSLLVRAMLDPEPALLVREARIEIAGGDVTLDPFKVPFSPLVLDLKLRLTRVGLQDLAALVPEVLAEARGRVDGVIGVRWSEAGGLQLGDGHLAVRKDEPAEVRLAPTPGLISANLPADALKLYPGLGQIETGEIPLRAELLEVTFTPNGDAEGRTAHVRLAGGPVDPTLRAPVDLTINVRGPLEPLIKLGTTSGLQFGGEP